MIDTKAAVAGSAASSCSTASKVLFLDIDGVLNSTERARNNIPYSVFMPEGLAFLRHLVAHGVRIVVSSSWRLGRTIPQLSEALTVPVADVTPRSPFESCRGEEIQSWLDANGAPDYCIIDDDNDMLPEQRPRFVRTTCELGMQPWHMDEVCRVLSLPSNPELTRPAVTDARATTEPVAGSASSGLLDANDRAGGAK